MERSLYIDWEKYKDCDTLLEVFAEVNKRPRIENDIRKIIPQGTFSNIDSQVWMYVELKKEVVTEINNFASSFGFFRYGTTYFWSHPYCSCNNPRMIRYTSEIREISTYVLKHLGGGHPMSDALNVKTCTKGWYPDEIYKDDKYFYVPYRQCNGMITPRETISSGVFKGSIFGGCSAPDDTGYILHEIPKDLNFTDNSSITRFKCKDGIECAYYEKGRASWLDQLSFVNKEE